MDDGSINAVAGSDVVTVAHTPAAPNPNAVEHHQKRKAIISKQGPPEKRRTMNRIVRDWKTSTIAIATNNDDDDDEKPPEPTTAPPPLHSSTIRLQSYCPMFQLLTWSCDHIGFTDEIYLLTGYVKLVSYDTKHTYRVEIHDMMPGPNRDPKVLPPFAKSHRRIVCVPLVLFTNPSMTERGPCFPMMKGDQDPNEDFLTNLFGRIRSSKKFADTQFSVDDNEDEDGTPSSELPPPPPVTLIIHSEIAPPVPSPLSWVRTSSDDIRLVLQSKTFHDRVSSWCQELNINAKYYTPFFENESSKERPPTKNTSNVVQKSAMEWWKKPQYSIDYCFESIIQEIIQEENTALSTTADGDIAAVPVSDSMTVVTPSTTTVESSVVKGKKVKSPSKRRKIAPIAAVARNSNVNSNKRMRH